MGDAGGHGGPHALRFYYWKGQLHGTRGTNGDHRRVAQRQPVPQQGGDLDGDHDLDLLRDTIADLKAEADAVITVAVVPVGLTHAQVDKLLEAVFESSRWNG